MSIATTRVSILRGLAVADEYLDVEQSGQPVATGIPASIIERTRKVFTADTQEPMTVRYISGRLPAGTMIKQDDQIKDEITGVIYSIEDFFVPASPVHSPDVHLELKRIT